jgi:ASC-1-like (ASCH) protein
MGKDEIEAVVDSVLGRGRKRFVVTYPKRQIKGLKKGDSITFSMAVWEGSKQPLRGQVVILSDVQEFEKGWRARSARPNTL